MTVFSGNDELFGRTPKREPAVFTPAANRQPITTPIPVEMRQTDRCEVHKRAFSYREQQRQMCSWCHSEMFA